MKKLQNNFNQSFTDSLLNYIWRNWCALGVSGNEDLTTKQILDPEALLLLTCSVGRCDQRLFDEVMDWLTVNWELININRIRHMLKQYSCRGENELRPMAAWMIENHGKSTKWKSLSGLNENIEPQTPFFKDRDGSRSPLFGELDPLFLKYGYARGKIELRGYSRPFQKDNPACLLISLRSFFGTNVRAEIMAYLLTHPDGAHPSGIARETGYNQKSVQNALVAMKQSQWVNCRETGNEKIYSVDSGMVKSFLGQWDSPPKWINLSPVYCLIERVWEKVCDPEFEALSEGIQSIEIREAIMPLKKEIYISNFASVFSGQMQGKEFLKHLFSQITDFIQ